MKAAEYAAGLRLYADWLDEHQDLVDGVDPEGISLLWGDQLRMFGRDADTLAALARAFGKCDKKYSDDLFTLSAKFGVVAVEAILSRSSVCRKVVTGTRVIPETVVPAQPEKVIPERIEEIVEWECEPILAGGAS